jgi:D-amino-acid oxidase
MSRVTVVGAGVVGLTCAVRLLEDGHRVDVLARDLPLETTSAVAAAIWYPFRALPLDRVLAWSARTYEVFVGLAGVADSGVKLRRGVEVFGSPQQDPWWRSAVPGLDHVAPPVGYADAWTFVAPVVEMPVYLTWLASRVEELGGTITRLSVPALPSGADVVVNAAGIGARLLASDSTVWPVRGQVVYVEQVGLEQWWLDSSADLTYVVPRSHDIVVGGTDQDGDWSQTPSMSTAEEILARGRQLVPALASARVLRHRVGLRPARPSVRVERVASGGASVVHCYGHGGAGVTLSWGTADEVVTLVGEVSPP